MLLYEYHKHILTFSVRLKNTKKFNIQFLDAISERNPRVIDDTRARKLASDLKRCSYYETCATYGLNVERVFQDGKVSLLNIQRNKI